MSYVARDGGAYERGMGRWSRPLAALFRDALPLPPAGDILDAGCGTGALAAAILARHPASRITGLDPSPAFIAAARAGLPQARFATGDIQALDLPDASQDAALALLVLQFVPDPAGAVAEMARVTRPGGLVASAMWDFWGGFPFLRLFADTAAAMLPEAAAWRARHWGGVPIGSPGRQAVLFAQAGLVDVREQDLSIRQELQSFADWYEPWLAGEGIMGSFLMALAAPDRAALEAALRAAWGDPAEPRSFVATARMAQGRVALSA